MAWPPQPSASPAVPPPSFLSSPFFFFIFSSSFLSSRSSSSSLSFRPDFYPPLVLLSFHPHSYPLLDTLSYYPHSYPPIIFFYLLQCILTVTLLSLSFQPHPNFTFFIFSAWLFPIFPYHPFYLTIFSDLFLPSNKIFPIS